jgi:hypothetical protein
VHSGTGDSLGHTGDSGTNDTTPMIVGFLLLKEWHLGLPPAPPTGGRVLGASRATTFLLWARTDTTHTRRIRADVNRTLPASPSGAPQLRAGALMSITSNLTFFRGEDITLNFQMSPPNTDITGWNITWKLATALAGTVQVTKTATILDGPRGIFQVSIQSADTSSLSVGRYVWDCRRIDSGNRATLADGYLDLKQEVTA